MIIKKVLDSLKYIKIKDICAIFVFIIVIPLAFFYKLYLLIKKRKIWIICEAPNEACDNGYHLFKFIRTKHTEREVYYAINKKSNDYEKINKYSNIIQYGSIKHWIYYLVADLNISTHKYGNPSAPLFYFLQVYGILKNKRVFLQHGITYHDSEWLYYKNTKFKLFICGAKKEYEYVKNKFGYPEENVQYLGFSRFDNLHKISINKKQIVIMPTWRNWLGREKNILEKAEVFEKTEYFQRYYSLINNVRFLKFIENNDIIVYFFPHRNMQRFLKKFKTCSSNIKIVNNNDIDIQDLLRDSALMITDYSSVYMDFAYMKKPILYYQFDDEKYHKTQLKEGYFSCKNDGFGKVVETENKLIDEVIKSYNVNFVMEDVYKKRANDFFELNDQENSKRIYEFLLGL